MRSRSIFSIILVLALTAGGIAAWRKFHRPGGNEARKEKKDKSLQELSRITAETRAVETLARTLREFIRWRAAQPAVAGEAVAAELTRRLDAVPQADLPPDWAAVFGKFHAAWAARAAGTADPAISSSGQEASMALQKLLDARGHADIRL